MIVKLTKGRDIGGAIDYARGPGRDPEAQDRSTLIGGGGFGFDVTEDERTDEISTALMVQNGTRAMQGEKTKYCEKDCLHFSLSWDPSQSPPDLAEKRETAKKFLQSLGMENSMHKIYDHNDTEHPHIHIVASRINPKTRLAYDDYLEVRKAIDCALEKEREDALSGRRPIPEAKREIHAARELFFEPREPEPDREAAIDALYRAHEAEQRAAYLARKADREAVSDLYKAHGRENGMVDDGVGGRWAEKAAVDGLYRGHAREQRKERREVRRALFDRVIHGKMESPTVKQAERVGRSYGIPKNEARHYRGKELQDAKDRAIADGGDKHAKYVGGQWVRHEEVAPPKERPEEVYKAHRQHRDDDRPLSEPAAEAAARIYKEDHELLREQEKYAAKEQEREAQLRAELSEESRRMIDEAERQKVAEVNKAYEEEKKPEGRGKRLIDDLSEIWEKNRAAGRDGKELREEHAKDKWQESEPEREPQKTKKVGRDLDI